MKTYKRLLDLISTIYCNVRTRTKVDVSYLVQIILPKRIICDSECQYPHRHCD